MRPSSERRLDRQICFFVDGETHDRLTGLLEHRRPQEGDPAPPPTFSSIARAALARGLAALEGEKASTPSLSAAS